ncbi:MAG TPA: cytochrome c maturation protein CcmE [Acidimicrobiales bacterium]|nr:cytochrome c maturation protein CcmE [Acidimicrobiales bacterium]
MTRRRLWVVGTLIAVAIGLILFEGLGNATVYFKTADEAVRDRDSMGTRRFRIEGTVVAGSVQATGDGSRFRIENNGAVVPVVHHGDPPELFKPGIPVVLEGHWQGTTYDSDLIMVKHTEDYRAKHPTRVQDYPQGK